VKEQKNYLIIITSDHGGHDKIHGIQHPDDFRLPFVIHSDRIEFESVQNSKYGVTDLRNILNGFYIKEYREGRPKEWRSCRYKNN
jgi:hypothetical protein